MRRETKNVEAHTFPSLHLVKSSLGKVLASKGLGNVQKSIEILFSISIMMNDIK